MAWIFIYWLTPKFRYYGLLKEMFLSIFKHISTRQNIIKLTCVFMSTKERFLLEGVNISNDFFRDRNIIFMHVLWSC